MAALPTSIVFKCEHDGVVIYSQLSCGEGAQQVEVKLQQPEPKPKLKQGEDTGEAKESLQDEVQTYIAQQGKNRKIAQHTLAIQRYKKQMADEFADMQQQRYRSAGDKKDAIATLSKKYDALIRTEQAAIKALMKQSKKE
jgi:hypothetical protein